MYARIEKKLELVPVAVGAALAPARPRVAVAAATLAGGALRVVATPVVVVLTVVAAAMVDVVRRVLVGTARAAGTAVRSAL